MRMATMAEVLTAHTAHLDAATRKSARALLDNVFEARPGVRALSTSDAGADFYAARGWRRWQGPSSALTPTGSDAPRTTTAAFMSWGWWSRWICLVRLPAIGATATSGSARFVRGSLRAKSRPPRRGCLLVSRHARIGW